MRWHIHNTQVVTTFLQCVPLRLPWVKVPIALPPGSSKVLENRLIMCYCDWIVCSFFDILCRLCFVHYRPPYLLFARIHGYDRRQQYWCGRSTTGNPAFRLLSPIFHNRIGPEHRTHCQSYDQRPFSEQEYELWTVDGIFVDQLYVRLFLRCIARIILRKKLIFFVNSYTTGEGTNTTTVTSTGSGTNPSVPTTGDDSAAVERAHVQGVLSAFAVTLIALLTMLWSVAVVIWSQLYVTVVPSRIQWYLFQTAAIVVDTICEGMNLQS